MSTATSWKRVAALAFALAILTTACGDGDDGDENTSEAGDGEATAVEATDLQLSATDLGEILVDAQGNTLYLFVPDSQGESTCYDECEANWPIVGELATVGDGLDASLLGTTNRTTGDVQATYNGWPLYYFVNDAGPGESNGQGVNDVWYVVDAAGDAVGG